MRAALEALAARLVVELPEEEKDQAIRDLEDALAVMADAEGDSLVTSLEADVDFHRTLCRVSGNAALLQSWEQLAGVVAMSIMVAGRSRARVNTSAQRHREVIDVIVGGGPEVERRITEHVVAVLGDFGIAG